MVMNVNIICKEMITPSSPTPPHLRNHKLSFLDQLSPPVYIPILLFYEHSELGSNNIAQKSQSLKQSLSHTLTQFYPLAGRIENNTFIDCNDAGAEYVEAQVNAPLSRVIENPNMEELKQLYLPIQPYGSGGMGKDIVLAIQVNFFDCGGLAIGVCISHKIADGSSLVAFINAWASTSRGNSATTRHPDFDLGAFHFKPRDIAGFAPTSGMTKERIMTRRFVFDKTKLEALKEGVGSDVKDPTRVEAVSAFIWKQFMEVSKAKMEAKKLFAGIHAVNLRHRMIPPLPDHAFGNMWTFSNALLTAEGDHQLLGQLRNSIRKIDGDYVKELQNRNGSYLDYLKKSKDQLCMGEVETCSFSSWCRFPVYEADYGWGKPVWASTTTLPFKNVVILMSTRCGNGIEAWVNMVEEDVAMIEHRLNDFSLVARG